MASAEQPCEAGGAGSIDQETALEKAMNGILPDGLLFRQGHFECKNDPKHGPLGLVAMTGVAAGPVLKQADGWLWNPVLLIGRCCNYLRNSIIYGTGNRLLRDWNRVMQSPSGN